MFDEMPNVLIVHDDNEKPEEIVNYYLAIITHYKNDPDALLEILEGFFDDVNYWTIRQTLIDQAKANLDSLKQLDELEHEFIEDDDFDDEEY